MSSTQTQAQFVAVQRRRARAWGRFLGGLLFAGLLLGAVVWLGSVLPQRDWATASMAALAVVVSVLGHRWARRAEVVVPLLLVAALAAFWLWHTAVSSPAGWRDWLWGLVMLLGLRWLLWQRGTWHVLRRLLGGRRW